MNVRYLAIFLGIWLGFALVGGIMDGTILSGHDSSGARAHAGDAQILNEAQDINIGQEESTGGVRGFLANVWRGLAATVGFLEAWVNMLALNFSFFTGEWAIVGWFVRGLIGIPMATMMLLSLR